VTFKRYATAQGRQSWTCTACGHHVHPTAGTIFHGSSTSLHLWFYAMYLMASTRCGISAKHLERELGVSYRTSWRMLNRIRTELMAQDDEPLSGEVEADETHWGGSPRLGEVEKYRKPGETDLSGAGGRWKAANKATVFAMVERGGRVRADVVASRQAATLLPQVVKYVLPESTIFTDEWPSYNALGVHYRHHRIRHTEKVYVSGDVTPRPSRASSRTSSGASPGPITRSPVSGSSPTSTSTRFAIASGTTPARCSRPC
jgi:transposase-like protein